VAENRLVCAVEKLLDTDLLLQKLDIDLLLQKVAVRNLQHG